MILSKISTFASTAIPTVKIIPAIPGNVKVASNIVRIPTNKNKFIIRVKFVISPKILYFKNKLLDWREELLQETTQTLASLQESTNAAPDLTDRATVESERSLELRTRDRERKLVSKIDQALIRIEEGTYGYCEETDEPIGLRRLQARPIATLSLEAQERHERRERVYRDD